MKLRIGFVSNSSSSSFVIDKKDIKPSQLKAIHHHIKIGRHLHILYAEERQAWDIEETPLSVRFSTCMDNFDMLEFLERIGVPADAIHDLAGH